MTLTTKRLTLTPVNMSHLQSTFEYAGNPENTKFMMFLPYDSLEETREVLEQSVKNWYDKNPAYRHFAIMLGDTHIGEITLYFVDDPKRAELGWVIHRDYWNRGYTTEAALAMLEYAKRVWDIECVFACCDSENTGSYRVMEKIGMHRVSCTPGRKNRSSQEARYELLYEIML
ncbi:MAG: GNAT family N-acetyltransferase [Oscillospiraceae bacterium]|nr:GNAT family N-acetyltransferase [Oscillospiraceae bacterium]